MPIFVLELKNTVIMAENFVKVDVSKIDEELKDIENQIAMLNAEKTIKLGVKEFILNNAVPDNAQPKDMAELPISQYGGLSDFLLNFIKTHNGVGTSAVIEAYARHVNKKTADISNNVSNALARLRTLEKVRSEKLAGGSRTGNKWFTK